MDRSSLVWAGVPHNSDGVVFQIRVGRGLQRFHISRLILEKACELERLASDARQLESFYEHLAPILAVARKTRSSAKADTVSLNVSDFVRTGNVRVARGSWVVMR
ncbi:TPA: hypothetical protein QDC20_000422 [Burkholderia aenigmatica]|uniref:hypothetical protein n=1 Tax=Burkholderia sp. AU45251 TaxID=3059204 RepID=UPI002650C311|nr:hypothetical protein [Burkholderia sp. AU45251]HDR9482282.1 hypothetical protein [Burkholderia aenigmatica]MDN7515081.1 hypothetical protein [Burkholderia sp. AU45251]HDR9514588.1 hypothetical protein [Burkholderia aenigmatica]HDR9590653.1 hypothetical protein [Burkholderia aenigmatica]HDR9599809.1 hypothetical protein [Burkholderia aenigmatica]